MQPLNLGSSDRVLVDCTFVKCHGIFLLSVFTLLARMLHKQSALKRLTLCGIEIAAFENDKRSLPYPLSRRVAAGWTVIGRDGWPILD